MERQGRSESRSCRERDLWKVPEPEVADVLNSTENPQTTWGVREKSRESA